MEINFRVKNIYAVPGAHNIIDGIHTETGRGIYSNETLDQIRARHPGAEIMTMADFCEAKHARQNMPLVWDDTTDDVYEKSRCCLPPARYGKNSFLVGEPDDHCAKTGWPRYRAFKHDGDKYLVASRPMTLREFDNLPKE